LIEQEDDDMFFAMIRDMVSTYRTAEIENKEIEEEVAMDFDDGLTMV
jgi:hypothetical protein